MDNKHLALAIKSAIKDTKSIVDEKNTQFFNDEFARIVNLPNPYERLEQFYKLLEQVEPV